MFSKRFNLFLVVALAASYCTGTLSQTSSRSVTLASEEDETNWSRFECPDEATFKQLAKTVKLNLKDFPGTSCDSGRKGKMARLLLFLSRVKITELDNWKGGATSALTDAVKYLATSNNFLGTDFKQVTSVAYNQQKSVFIGGIFFDTAFFDSVDTLIHESRHSHDQADNHVQCRLGDIPKKSAGCDMYFRNDEHSGAYSYTVSFLYGVAELQPGLSAKDRDELRADALWYVGTRFNQVPEFLAQPYDVIAFLTEKHELFNLHPFFELSFKNDIVPAGEIANRIEFNNQNNGLSLYTTSKHYLTWSRGQKTAKYFKNKHLPTPPTVVDANVLSVGDDDHFYFINGDDEFWFLDINPKTGERLPSRSHYKPRFNATRIFLAQQTERYSRNDQGTLFYFGDKNDLLKSAFQDPQKKGWISNSAGIVFEELYGVNADGQLWVHEAKADVESIFKAPSPVVKFQEAASFRVQLDRQNNFYIAYYDTKEFTPIALPSETSHIVDFVAYRTYRPDDVYHGWSKAVSPEFVKQCGLHNATIDPWLKKGIGLNAEQKLVFEGTKSRPCLTFDKFKGEYGPIADFGFESLETDKQSNKFGAVYLMVKFQNGRQVQVFPYTGAQREVTAKQ